MTAAAELIKPIHEGIAWLTCEAIKQELANKILPSIVIIH